MKRSKPTRPWVKRSSLPERTAWLCRRDEGVRDQFMRLQRFGSSFRSELELNGLNRRSDVLQGFLSREQNLWIHRLQPVVQVLKRPCSPRPSHCYYRVCCYDGLFLNHSFTPAVTTSSKNFHFCLESKEQDHHVFLSVCMNIYRYETSLCFFWSGVGFHLESSCFSLRLLLFLESDRGLQSFRRCLGSFGTSWISVDSSECHFQSASHS